MITDAVFYAIAIPAVLLSGISKGGLSGLGALAVPMLALVILGFTGIVSETDLFKGFAEADLRRWHDGGRRATSAGTKGYSQNERHGRGQSEDPSRLQWQAPL